MPDEPRITRKPASASTLSAGWRMTSASWGVLAAPVLLMVALSFDSLAYMVALWSKEEYGYAYVLPAVSAFMIWQKRELLRALPFEGSWSGAALVAAGVVLTLLGELSTLHVLVQYGFLVVLAGVVLALMGWRPFRHVVPALALLAFAVPLPNFLYQAVSDQLQLASSQLGVALIHAFGISVFLEGNVIDLGTYKLQVVEACNGLRYLFPLAALGYIAAYFFHGALWKRAVILLSTVPITVAMNSVRIAIIGVMVDRWGVAMAEGFLHDFEGWAVFMVCIVVLVLEMSVLARIGRNGGSLRSAFGFDTAAAAPTAGPVQSRAVPRPLAAATAVVAVAVIAAFAVPHRVDVPVARTDLAGFPMQLGEWNGKPDRMEKMYLDVLKLSDYILADYAVASDRPPVNLYVAYYASQRKGESAHSPRSCIPGGGWEITTLTEHSIPGGAGRERPLRVNRALIQKGSEKQLVYYWFQQRGRLITNEYLVKWFLFWDALTRNRTDGALVRLITPVDAATSMADVDADLAKFARLVESRLSEFVPE